MKATLSLGVYGASSLETDALLDGIATVESFRPGQVRVFGQRGSVGKRLSCGEQRVVVEEATLGALRDCDVVFLAATPSEALESKLTESGVLCIDLCSWRHSACENGLVPWVNGARLLPTTWQVRRRIFVPNPLVALCATAVSGLSREVGLCALAVTTCESSSFLGKPGLDLLREESSGFFETGDLSSRSSSLLSRSMAFNVMPVEWEQKQKQDAHGELARSLVQVLGVDALGIDVMRLRVPAFVGMAASLTVGLAHEVSPQEALSFVESSWGKIEHDGASCSLREVHGSDSLSVSVARSAAVPCGISMWLAADNLCLLTRNALGCVDYVLRNGMMPALKGETKGS